MKQSSTKKPPLREFEIQCKRGRAIVHTIKIKARSYNEAGEMSKKERDKLSIRRFTIRDMTKAQSTARNGGVHERSLTWGTYYNR